jgi:hypothetical protein
MDKENVNNRIQHLKRRKPFLGPPCILLEDNVIGEIYKAQKMSHVKSKK